MPPLMPPPASQMEKPWPLWSRPAVVVQLALAHRQPADLAAPVDERRVEQAALLQVLHQGRGRLVGPPADRRQRRCGCCCGCPTAGRRGRAARSARRARPAGGRSGSACRTRASRSGRGRTACWIALRLLRDVERLLGGRLHRGGQFVAGDAGFQVGLARVRSRGAGG